jgi:hypothetical protein
MTGVGACDDSGYTSVYDHVVGVVEQVVIGIPLLAQSAEEQQLPGLDRFVGGERISGRL